MVSDELFQESSSGHKQYNSESIQHQVHVPFIQEPFEIIFEEIFWCFHSMSAYILYFWSSSVQVMHIGNEFVL